ncbi:MAG TPA: SDR family oxidoreductase [Candidatus Eremiobacteraeota bacterium]|nr:MAG: Glucose 1-dehydrogenase 1 [bacterium ADurb.Bin363]HPZ10358.1 SDR family oxidoreductase [Candidatus Eremiobacteraeota bacterium]
MNIKGKVVLITGGARGIGKATAKLFALEGSKIIICSRNKEELDDTCKEILSAGGDCLAIECDIKKSSDVKNLVQKSINKYGHIDILINNAGTGYYKLLLETTEEEWNETIDTNLKGVFLLCKECIPYIKKGIIINISSGAGKKGLPRFSAYCASKFGVIGLTESFVEEFQFIKFYALCPGPVDTKLFRDNFHYSPPGKPEEIARIIIDLSRREYLKSGESLVIS